MLFQVGIGSLGGTVFFQVGLCTLYELCLARQISMNQLKIWNRNKWTYLYVYGSGLFVDGKCASGRCIRIIYFFVFSLIWILYFSKQVSNSKYVRVSYSNSP